MSWQWAIARLGKTGEWTRLTKPLNVCCCQLKVTPKPVS